MKPAVIADAIVDALTKALAGPRVSGRFAQLESRVNALEARPSIKFAGTFQGGRSYEPGDTVIHQSALWICKAATTGTPSKDFVGWQLALKKGDAK
jgi:hypothetical protein